MNVAAKSGMRFLSIDAIRGLTVAAMLLVNNAGDWDHVYPWLEHASWHGCTPPDFIFPMFLVIVGVSLFLALTPKLEANVERGELCRTVLWRGVRMFALGILLHWIAQLLIPGREFRLLGVLQRIAICFVIVGLLVIYVRRIWVYVGLVVAILLGYWLVLWSGGSYEPNLNLADQIDTRILGKLAYSFDSVTGLAQEPEGILSTIPAIANVLMGVIAAALLRSNNAQRLWQYGVLAMLLGFLWANVLPLNKQLWTSSFVLVTSGFSFITMFVAHYLIDQKTLPALGRSFGVNAIAAYGGSWVATCLLAASGWMPIIYPKVFASAWLAGFGPNFSSFAFAAAFTAIFAVVMRILFLRGWRFSI